MTSQIVKKSQVLVVQPLPGMGDIIWHLPHLKAIAANTVSNQITLLTKDRSLAHELLLGTQYIKEVLYLSKVKKDGQGILGGFRLGNFLKPYKFDQVWILHGSPRYGIAALRAGIKDRIGYGIGWQDAFLTSPHTMTREDMGLGAIKKASRCLELNGIEINEKKPQLTLTTGALNAAKTLLKNNYSNTVGLAIGSSESSKQWGAQNFIHLIDSIRAKYQSQIVLIGGPDDSAIARSINENFESPDWITQAIGLPILEASAVSSLCNICIGNDTGILNIAAATGTFSIGLYIASAPQNDDPLIKPIIPPKITTLSNQNIEKLTNKMIMETISTVSGF